MTYIHQLHMYISPLNLRGFSAVPNVKKKTRTNTLAHTHTLIVVEQFYEFSRTTWCVYGDLVFFSQTIHFFKLGSDFFLFSLFYTTTKTYKLLFATKIESEREKAEYKNYSRHSALIRLHFPLSISVWV